jgi:hypothetical protein
MPNPNKNKTMKNTIIARNDAKKDLKKDFKVFQFKTQN